MDIYRGSSHRGMTGYTLQMTGTNTAKLCFAGQTLNPFISVNTFVDVSEQATFILSEDQNSANLIPKYGLLGGAKATPFSFVMNLSPVGQVVEAIYVYCEEVAAQELEEARWMNLNQELERLNQDLLDIQESMKAMQSKLTTDLAELKTISSYSAILQELSKMDALFIRFLNLLEAVPSQREKVKEGTLKNFEIQNLLSNAISDYDGPMSSFGSVKNQVMGHKTGKSIIQNVFEEKNAKAAASMLHELVASQEKAIIILAIAAKATSSDAIHPSMMLRELNEEFLHCLQNKWVCPDLIFSTESDDKVMSRLEILPDLFRYIPSKTPQNLRRNYFKVAALQSPILLKEYPEFNDIIDIVTPILKEDGRMIEHASDRIKKNKDMGKIAVQNNGFSLAFLHPSISTDPDIINAALEQTPLSVCCIEDQKTRESLIVQLAINPEIPTEIKEIFKDPS